jgi:hypothetical protein
MRTQLELFASLPLVRDPASYWKRYQRYLRSHVWQHIRRTTFELADYACQANKPGCTGRAEECHHRTYLFWSRGLDRPGDHTIAVCRNCHSWIHSHPIMWADPANDNGELSEYVA